MFGFDLGDRLLLGVVGVVGVLVLDLVLGLLDDPVTAVVIGDTVDASDPNFNAPILLGGEDFFFGLLTAFHAWRTAICFVASELSLFRIPHHAPGRLFEGVACPSASGRDPTRAKNQNLCTT
jgi:hypothetical protein